MFWKLISKAGKSIIENRSVLAKALLIPFLIYCSLYLIIFFLPVTWFSQLAGWLIYGVYAIFAITTHRVVLLGSNSIPEWGLLKWTKRETLFTLHLLALWVISMVAAGILGFTALAFSVEKSKLPELLFLIVLVSTIIYLYGKLSLVFPSIAINQGIGFKGAWELSKGYEGLIIFIVVLFPILIFLPVGLCLVLYIGVLGSLPDQALIDLFSELLYLPFTILVIAALSVTYRFILDEREKEKVSETETIEKLTD